MRLCRPFGAGGSGHGGGRRDDWRSRAAVRYAGGGCGHGHVHGVYPHTARHADAERLKLGKARAFSAENRVKRGTAVPRFTVGVLYGTESDERQYLGEYCFLFAAIPVFLFFADPVRHGRSLHCRPVQWHRSDHGGVCGQSGDAYADSDDRGACHGYYGVHCPGSPVRERAGAPRPSSAVRSHCLWWWRWRPWRCCWYV